MPRPKLRHSATRTIRLAAALALAAAVPGAAFAASPVDPAFGNTIVSTYEDGRTAELWLAPGGTYTAEGRKHDRSNGRWVVKGSDLCLKQSHPFAFGMTYCTPIPSTGLGQSWSAKSVFGDPVTVRLETGHVVPPAKTAGS